MGKWWGWGGCKQTSLIVGGLMMLMIIMMLMMMVVVVMRWRRGNRPSTTLVRCSLFGGWACSWQSRVGPSSSIVISCHLWCQWSFLHLSSSSSTKPIIKMMKCSNFDDGYCRSHFYHPCSHQKSWHLGSLHAAQESRPAFPDVFFEMLLEDVAPVVVLHLTLSTSNGSHLLMSE